MGKLTKVPVYDYSQSVHFGVCNGPATACFGIYVKGKLAWPPAQTDGDNGVNRCPSDLDYLALNLGSFGEDIDPEHPEILTTQRTIFIDETDLFGGDHRSGGVKGVVEWLPGFANQLMPRFIANRLGYEDPAECPAYRDVATMFFTGGRKPEPVRNAAGLIVKAAVTGIKVIAKKASGFRWGTNFYEMPPVGVRVFICPDAPPLSAWLNSVHETPGFPAEEAQVLVIKTPFSPPRKKPNSGGKFYEQGGGFPSANPAAAIYYILASGAYDINAREEMLDAESFITCARILSKEQLGVSIQITEDTPVKDIVGEILNHVGGALFTNPVNGKWTMRLFRPDADFDDLWGNVPRPEMTDIVIDPSNAVQDGDIERQTWSDIVNTVDVTYTEDESQERKTITLINNSAMAASGGESVRDSLDFRFFRNEEAARTAGIRALSVSSEPMVSGTWVLHQGGQDLVPLDVVTVNWPSEGLVNARFRVLSVDRGDSEDHKVKVSAVQDVFAAKTAQVAHGIQPPLWEPETTTPVISDEYHTTLNAPMARLAGYSLDQVKQLEADGEVLSANLIASRQTMVGAELYTAIGSSSQAGQPYADDPDFVAATPCARIGTSLGVEDHSVLNFYELDFGPQEDDVDVGDVMLIVRPSDISGEKHFKTPFLLGAYRTIHRPPLDWSRGGQYYASTYHYPMVGFEADNLKSGWGGAVLALDDNLPSSQHAWKIGSAYRDEVCVVTSVNRETGLITIRRGCYDTVPAPVTADSVVWHIKGSHSYVSEPEAQNMDYRDTYKPISVSGVSTDYHPAPYKIRVPRAYMPPRNANVRLTAPEVGSVSFGTRMALSEPQDITVSWSTRHRHLEDLQPEAFSDPSVTPEAGQLTNIRVYRRVRRGEPYLVPVRFFYDIPGASYVLPHWVFNDSMIDPEWNRGKDANAGLELVTDLVPTDITHGASFVIAVSSQKYGDADQGEVSGIWESLQSVIMLVDIGTAPGGWGNKYGLDYGGTD